MVEAARTVLADDAGLAAVEALLLELGGAPAEEVEQAYADALVLDETDVLALLGRARSVAATDPDLALELATRSLPEIGLRTDRVLVVAQRLLAFGAKPQALALAERILEHAPFDGGVALVLLEERVAAGDFGDRTLDLARRATRFARSPRTRLLLDQVRARRGGRSAPAVRSDGEDDFADARAAGSDAD